MLSEAGGDTAGSQCSAEEPFLGEKTPDAVQALGFEEALGGETGAGKGTWREKNAQ